MKNCIKITSVLLAAIMLTAVLTACSKPSVDLDETKNTEDQTGNIQTEEDIQFVSDNIPNLDLGGETVRIFCWESWDPSEFFVEDDTGDIIDTAVYFRNLAVAERLNVTLEWDKRPRNSSAYGNELKTAVMQQNQAGDNTYDLVACYGMRVASCAVDGLLMNLNDGIYIDLNQPWYYDSATQAGTLYKGYTYFCAGDISYNALARMSGVFFNRGIINDYQLDDPYDLVLNGTWTIEMMNEMIKGMYVDLDTDGAASDKDQFGIMCANDQMQTLYYGTGSHFIDHDENDSPKICDDVYSERTVTILDKYLKLFSDQSAYKNPLGDDPSIFDEGRTLFYIYPLGHVSEASLRESEIDYGFIPQPKVSETDEKYHASVTNAVTLFAIPFVIESNERASALLECLASEGYRQVTPVVFEQAYKSKYNYDDSTRQSVIFDMLRENAVFDLGKIFSSDLFSGFSNGVIGDMIWNNKNNYSSTVAGYELTWTKAIEKLTEKLDIEKN